MESLNKVFAGAIFGFKRNGWYEDASFIGKVSEFGNNTVTSYCQKEEGGYQTYNTYRSENIIELPLSEELLQLEGFVQSGNTWTNEELNVSISKNPNSFSRKWNLRIVDNDELVVEANFNNLNEFQFYCFQSNIPLKIKLASARIIYEDYIKEQVKANSK